MSIAEDWVCCMLYPYMLSSFTKFEECTVDLSKSAGYPLKQSYGSKRQFFEANDWREIKNNYHSKVYWDVFPKHEILPREKAREKSRIICGAPADLYALATELYYAQNEQMSASTLKFGSGIGLNPFSGGWDEIASYVGNFVDEADCKQWDSRMNSAWLNAIYRIRWNLLTPESQTEENWKAHCYFLDNLVDSVFHDSFGRIYFVEGGNKSGSPNTCHDNTIGHLMLIAYCFIRMGKSFNDFISFKKVVFGDDYLAEHIEPSFWDYYREFGVNLPSVKTCHISEASFLSNKFLSTPYGYMPLPNGYKGLVSAYTSDEKNIAYKREERLPTLWLIYFWSFARTVLREACESSNVKLAPDFYAVMMWSKWMAGGTKRQFMKDGDARKAWYEYFCDC